MANDGIIFSGFLVKSPPLDGGFSVKSWKKRWFVLRKSNVLEYYKDKNAKAPKGVINLEECESVDSGLRMKKGKHVFDVVTKARTYYLSASSEKEEEDWVKALCEQCQFTLEEADSTARSATLNMQTGKSPSNGGLVRRASMPAIRSGRRQSPASSAPSEPELSEKDGDNIENPDTNTDQAEILTLPSAFTPSDHPSSDSGYLSSKISPDENNAQPSAEEKKFEKMADTESCSNAESPQNSRKPSESSAPISIPGCQSHTRHRLSSSFELNASSPPTRPPKSLSEQQPETEGYATLTADDFQPPRVDRSKKPRSSLELAADPDAPPIDRSRKPTGPLNVSATIPIDGAAFIQVPEVTAATRRYSRPMYYAVPPGSVTLVAVPAHSLPQGAYSVPPTLQRSVSSPAHRQDIAPSANYDYPPSRTISMPTHTNYDYPPPPRSSNYDYPPGTHAGPPRLQRSMSASPGMHGLSRSYGPSDNYSYPPAPVPANRVGSHPIPIGGRPVWQSRTSVDSRISVSSHASHGSHQSHSSFPLDDNDGGDYIFTEVQGDEAEESYEFMAAGVMAGSRGTPARPPKPSL